MLGDAGVGMGEAGEGGSGAVVGGVRGRVSRGEWGGVARPRMCRVSRGAGGGVAGHRGVRCRVSRGVGGGGTGSRGPLAVVEEVGWLPGVAVGNLETELEMDNC